MFRAWNFRILCGSVLLAFALVSGAVGMSIWRDRANAIDDSVRDARNIAVLLGRQIERSIQSVDGALRGLQRQIAVVDVWTPSDSMRAVTLRGVHGLLLRERDNLPPGSNIILTDAGGQVLASTSSWPAPDINIADREYFTELAVNDDGRLSISQPFDSRVTGRPTIVLARRISGPDHALLGVVFVSMPRAYFESIYGAVNSLPHQTFTLMRRDGTVLVSYLDPQDRVGQKVPATSPFHAMVADGGGSFRSTGAFDRVVRWIAASPLAEFPLVVTIAIPEAVILQGWWARATFTVAGTLVFLTCALALLAVILKHEAVRLTQNERFNAALSNMSQGIAVFDGHARLVVCNERYSRMLRLSPEQTKPGYPLRDILVHCHDCCGFPASVDDFIAEILAVVAGRQSRAHEIEDIDGRIISVKNDPMPGGGWVVAFEDITDQRASDARIKYLAHNDVLTGIANRSHFVEEIEAARARLLADGQPFSVLVLDLDRFKHVNDSLGHAAGDMLLKEAARRLQASLRSVDVVARLGGDEFAIIQTPPRKFRAVEDAANAMRESAVALANRIIAVMAQPYDIDDHRVMVGASIGIAMAPADAVDPDELMKKADLALYTIKTEGRNGFSFFDAGMEEAADERHQLEIDLRAGLARDEFELYFQPLVSVGTRQTCCMEALVCWHHPSRGLITPDRFMAVAEDTGLVTSLGEWIIRAACAEAAKWPADIKVAIDISPVQFRKTNLVDVMTRALVASGLAPERVEIEITERVLQEKEAGNLAIMHQLKNLGVAIALGDFGTGYSSLGYLTIFPFDKIKIDKSFTSELLERSDCASIVCAIINLGRVLGIATVAEGVETQRQFEALRAAGLSEAQGYLFGRPTPAAEVSFAPATGESLARRA